MNSETEVVNEIPGEGRPAKLQRLFVSHGYPYRAEPVYFAHMPRKTPTRALKDISYTRLSSLSLILEQI